MSQPNPNEIRVSVAKEKILQSTSYQKLLQTILAKKFAEQRANDKN